MAKSKQTTFTLLCAAVLSVALPGFAGYASAKFEAYDQTKRELARLRAQLDEPTIQGPRIQGPRIHKPGVARPTNSPEPSDPAIAGYFMGVPGVAGRDSCGSALWPER
ncbi:hypothetical protein GCM10009555_014140 [Acrocarpospora macrocephala]|uniref:Uncharacterized protein n=1 Tax=Acrocarpospora macrocephala TaxID=150177 RepID=A0A5M3WJL3_9ACTN|nr:hypothetical protein Amac_018170 [Acrocarpospora macrocephala]